MRRKSSSAWRILAVVLGLAMVAAACGDDGDDEAAETTETTAADEEATTTAGEDEAAGDMEVDLSGVELAVGSKEFTEQLILGHITKAVLEDAGATVEDQIGLQGSETVRNALTSGDIDLYYEYLGTGWVTHLENEEGIPGTDAQYDAVREADAENGIIWLEPTPFNDTFAIAMTDEKSAELGVETISDIGTLIEENPDEATLCAGGEFSTRQDGLPGMEAHYGFEFPADNITNVQDALVYTQVDEGACTFGSVFSTDGRIAALDLTVLDDNEDFFPPFNASLNVREEVLNENPDIEKLFDPISAALDDETITELNAMVDVDGGDPEEVARQWLTDEGYISG